MTPTTRFPMLGAIFVVFGLVIAVLSWPVSLASHGIAADLEKRKPNQADARDVGAMKAGADAWRFAEKHQDNELVRIFQAIVAVLSIVWCCCVCLVTWIAMVAIEPLGDALGSAAEFSVMTFALMLGAYGLAHIAAGVGLIIGRTSARLGTQTLLIFDGIQGLYYLGATFALWNAANPTYGIISLCLGAILIALCVPAFWLLRRANAAAAGAESEPA